MKWPEFLKQKQKKMKCDSLVYGSGTQSSQDLTTFKINKKRENSTNLLENNSPSVNKNKDKSPQDLMSFDGKDTKLYPPPSSTDSPSVFRDNNENEKNENENQKDENDD